MDSVYDLLKLLKEVRDSPTLGEGSNAVVISPKIWRRIVEATTPKQR